MDPRTPPPRPLVDRVAGGYDPGFLGPQVPAPVAVDGRVVRELAYTHFTVWLDPGRRLGTWSAVNVDGAALREVSRSGTQWFLDPRVAAGEQSGNELYADNDLDRGHLVRRRGLVRGPAGVAERANADTFAYPNAVPMAAVFNQGRQLWLGLEDHDALVRDLVHRMYQDGWSGFVVANVDLLDVDEEAGA